jgi:hypothetical protein
MATAKGSDCTAASVTMPDTPCGTQVPPLPLPPDDELPTPLGPPLPLEQPAPRVTDKTRTGWREDALHGFDRPRPSGIEIQHTALLPRRHHGGHHAIVDVP